MPKRLIWNFEIAAAHSKAASSPSNAPTSATAEGLHWEARYFWPDNAIITLYGLDPSSLNLSRYTYKHREDTYFLLEPFNLNIKQRRDKLVYKPMLATGEGPLLEGINGFGKKINLHTYPAEAELPGLSHSLNAAALLQHLQTAPSIPISKEIVTSPFPGAPLVTLELSRLTLRTNTYFSLCLQGNSVEQIQDLVAHLLPEQVSCHYVNFLKQIKLTL